MASLFQKYYAFYLKSIFIQSPVKIDTFAATIKTQRPMAIFAIDELRNNGYLTVEDDLINITSKGLTYLVNNNLISLTDQEKAASIENGDAGAEKRSSAFKMTVPAMKLKMAKVHLKMPAVKLKMPDAKLKMPTIQMKLPKIKKPTISIVKNKPLETLAWVIGILCIIVVIGLVLAG